MVSVTEVVSIIVGFIIIYNILFIWKKRKFYKFAWKSKAFLLPVLPIVGNTYVGLLITLFYDRVSPLTAIRTLADLFGHPANFWNGHYYNYVTKNPSEIKVILNHMECYDKGPTYEFENYLFPNSLLIVPYDKWKPKRKYFQSSYKPSIIKSYVPTTYEESCNLVENVKLLNGNENIFNFFSEYTFQNFFKTSAGLKEENYCSDYKKFGTLVTRVQEFVSAIVIYFPFMTMGFWMQYLPSGRKCSKAIADARVIIDKLIEEKRKENQISAPVDSDRAMPLFDLMMNGNSRKMTHQEIFGEISLFTGAAMDTTGGTLSFCFTLLGMHPEIQEVLYEEVMDRIGNNVIADEDLRNLKYTEAVISETLRLFPMVPLVVRVTKANVVLEKYTIPEGTNIFIDIFHLHRDEQHWPNPLKFDPTRFLPEDAANIKPYTFIPFSAGPRDCIGKGQAMMIMKVTVANIIRNFKIVSKHKSINEFSLSSTVSLRTEEPLDCHFLPR